MDETTWTRRLGKEGQNHELIVLERNVVNRFGGRSEGKVLAVSHAVSGDDDPDGGDAIAEFACDGDDGACVPLGESGLKCRGDVAEVTCGTTRWSGDKDESFAGCFVWRGDGGWRTGAGTIVPCCRVWW